MQNRLIIATFVVSLVLAAGSLRASEVRIEGDRLTLHATNTPLKDILTSFAHAGVSIKVDPRIDIRVTGSCDQRDMQDALNSLLGDYAYVLIWEVVKGPLGDLPRLAEMQIFQPGAKDEMKPFAEAPRTLRVARGPTGTGPAFVEDEILIGMKPGTSLAAFRLLLAQIGGTVVGSIPELGIYQVRLLPGTNILDLVAQLSNNPQVTRIEPNYVTHIPSEQPIKDDEKAAVLLPVTIPKGAARVAVLDSGLLPASGIDSSIVASYDALNPGSPLTDPVGHGTQMAMIASGAIAPGGTQPTDASGTPVIAVRAFDDNGNTSNFALMRGIDYAIDQGARVINLSWGSDTSSDFVEAAVNYAQSQGLIVVASAGNSPTGKPVYPSAYPGVVSVSALDPSGKVWDQSNYGSTVTVSAPGMANFPVGHDGPPGPYAGTSISSAYVSREMAQYWTKNPSATADQVAKALTSAVTDSGQPGKDPYYGYGALDATATSKLLK